MKKNFSLKEYIENPNVKIVTRDGRDARIVCTDANDDEYPVVALVEPFIGKVYNPYLFSHYGFNDIGNTTDVDLFFEVEKTKVPLALVDMFQRIKQGKTMWLISDNGVFDFNIINFDINYVYYLDKTNVCFMTYTAMMEHGFTFADGSYCWKEIKE